MTETNQRIGGILAHHRCSTFSIAVGDARVVRSDLLSNRDVDVR